jgi:hypothetical protein
VSQTPQTMMLNSFAAGELSPTLYGRVDLEKYHTGLQTCRNAFVDYRGGITRRAGTRLVGPARDTTQKVRLVPFTYSTVQSYVLVFGNFSIRVIRNGGLVTEPTKTISRSGVTYTSTAHGYSTGDWISVTDLVQPIFVTVVDADHFTTTDVYSGASVSSNSTTAARIFTLGTPWGSGDIFKLKFTQSFDTLTITHPLTQTRNLTRTQHWVWTLSLVDPSTSIAAPTIVSVVGTLSGAPPAGTTLDTGIGFQVTAVDAAGQEGNPSSLVSGLYYGLNMETLPVTVTVTWNSVLGADHYNIYATTLTHGVAVDPGAPTGYIGTSVSTSFKDSDILPDFSKAPPTHQNPFASSNYPSVATYFDQRRVFANSNTDPQTLWMSKPGQFNNFDTSSPANDGDALTLTLSSVQSAAIRALLPMPDGMLVFTQSGVYKVSGGGQNTGIKVSSLLARAQNYIGITDGVPPIPVNFEIFFVQEKGAIIRALTYNFYTSTYEPADLTILSNHLFTGHTIVDWAYAEHPYKLVWLVREDGQLLCLTYLKDQKLQGWTRHDTNGLVESVCSITENGTDSVYIAVKRFINGAWTRYIEQFQSKDLTQGVEFSWYVDAALDYGSIYPLADITFSAATGSGQAAASASVFGSGDVGKVIRAANGLATVTSFVDAAHVNITWNRNPTDLIQPDPLTTAAVTVRPQLSGAWTMAAKVTSLSGLNHLNNMQVSYLADGVPGVGTVSSTGTLTIPTAASKVIVGLGFRTQCQTLDLEPSGQSTQGKRKRVLNVIAKVEDTGVLQWGSSFSEMTPWVDIYGSLSATGLMSGEQPLGVDQFYDYGGRICWQQDQPLPMTILSLVPEISVGD